MWGKSESNKDAEQKELTEFIGQGDEFGALIYKYGSGTLEERKASWQKSSDTVDADSAMMKKLESIPELLEKPTMKKLAKAVLIQQEYIMFMRAKKKEDLKEVTLFGHQMGIR